MAKLFISYSHENQDTIIEKIVPLLEKNHTVVYDKRNIQSGTFFYKRIKELIKDADYTLVFLSQNSIKSNHVSREIYEVIKEELKYKQLKLIPCLLENINESNVPYWLKKAKLFQRLYIDFTDIDLAVEILNESIKETVSIYEDASSNVLEIPERGYEIYLTGTSYHWDTNNFLKYEEALDTYVLFDFYLEEESSYKHFCLCDKDFTVKKNTIDYLTSQNLTVTGDGDVYEDKARIWFLINNNKISGYGLFRNNYYKNGM